MNDQELRDYVRSRSNAELKNILNTRATGSRENAGTSRLRCICDLAAPIATTTGPTTPRRRTWRSSRPW